MASDKTLSELKVVRGSHYKNEDGSIDFFPPSEAVFCNYKVTCPASKSRSRELWSTVELFSCMRPGCEKFCHDLCCRTMLEKNKVTLPLMPVYFCSLHCCKAYLKLIEKEKDKANESSSKLSQRTMWEADGSIDVLLDWITTEGNYKAYGGGGNVEISFP